MYCLSEQQNTMTQKQVDKERVPLAYTSILLFFIQGSQNKNWNRAGTWRHQLTQRTWRSAASWRAPHGLLSLFPLHFLFFFQLVNLFILHASFFFLFLLSSHFLLPSPLITTSSHPHTSNPLTPCFQYTILLFCSENGRPPLDVPVVYIVSCSKSGHLLSYWGWTREPSRIKGSQ